MAAGPLARGPLTRFYIHAAPDYPGKRMVACRNPELVKRRVKKRRALLDATVHLLKQEQSVVERGKLRGRKKILARADKIVKERGGCVA